MKLSFNKSLVGLGNNPEIDLFASPINYQVKPFVPYKPNPEAFAVNAFLLNWNR